MIWLWYYDIKGAFTHIDDWRGDGHVPACSGPARWEALFPFVYMYALQGEYSPPVLSAPVLHQHAPTARLARLEEATGWVGWALFSHWSNAMFSGCAHSEASCQMLCFLVALIQKQVVKCDVFWLGVGFAHCYSGSVKQVVKCWCFLVRVRGEPIPFLAVVYVVDNDLEIDFQDRQGSGLNFYFILSCSLCTLVPDYR